MGGASPRTGGGLLPHECRQSPHSAVHRCARAAPEHDDGLVSQAVDVPFEEYFLGHPFARDVFAAVEARIASLGPYSIRATKSQVSFRRTRAFAFIWIPGRYLAAPSADVVLAIALGRHHPSPRFKSVSHPAPNQWMHHLEIHDVSEVDDEVTRWLREAADRAG